MLAAVTREERYLEHPFQYSEREMEESHVTQTPAEPVAGKSETSQEAYP